MMSWLKTHWKKIAGYGCAVVAGALQFTPYAPIGAALGTVCGVLVASDYHAGKLLVDAANPVVKAVLDEFEKRQLAKVAVPPPLPLP